MGLPISLTPAGHNPIILGRYPPILLKPVGFHGVIQWQTPVSTLYFPRRKPVGFRLVSYDNI